MLRISLQHFAQHDTAIEGLPEPHSFAQNCFLMRRSETVQRPAIDKIVRRAARDRSKASIFFGSQR